jgi:hypothetical protein
MDGNNEKLTLSRNKKHGNNTKSHDFIASVVKKW